MAPSPDHRNTSSHADSRGENKTRLSALTSQDLCSTDAFKCKTTVYIPASPRMRFLKCGLLRPALPTLQTRHYNAVRLLNSSYFPSRLIGQESHRRWMSKKRRGKQQVEKEEEDEELSEDSEEEGEFGEEEDGPAGYKDKKVHLKSVRLDAIIAAGLNLGRNKAEEYFYSSQLRLNGEKVTKKSKQMSAGDYVDVIMETEETTLKVKRVKVLQIDPERTQTEKLVVHLRAWRSAFEIERPDDRPF